MTRKVTLLFVAALSLTACGVATTPPGASVDADAVRTTAYQEAFATVTAEAQTGLLATPVVEVVTVEVTRLVEVTAAPTETPSSVPATATPTPGPVVAVDARASRFVGGNLSPSFPDGEPGKLSIVYEGDYTGSLLYLVIRNNTDRPMLRVHVSAVAYSGDGAMLATGETGSAGFNPNYVGPGEATVGSVYFDDAELPEDVRFEFDVTGNDAEQYENIRDLDIVEVNLVNDRLVGIAANPYDEEVYLIEALVRCFDEQGNVLGGRSDFTDKDRVEAGDTLPFQIRIPTSYVCPVYLVTVQGFGSSLGNQKPVLDPPAPEA